jgi:hypothetical protein
MKRFWKINIRESLTLPTPDYSYLGRLSRVVYAFKWFKPFKTFGRLEQGLSHQGESASHLMALALIERSPRNNGFTARVPPKVSPLVCPARTPDPRQPRGRAH